MIALLDRNKIIVLIRSFFTNCSINYVKFLDSQDHADRYDSQSRTHDEHKGFQTPRGEVLANCSTSESQAKEN
jgi:hypothetical protein